MDLTEKIRVMYPKSETSYVPTSEMTSPCSNATGPLTSPWTDSMIWSGPWTSVQVPTSTSNLPNWNNFVLTARWCVLNSGVVGSTNGAPTTKPVLLLIWSKVSTICYREAFHSACIWHMEVRTGDTGQAPTLPALHPTWRLTIMMHLSVNPVRQLLSIGRWEKPWRNTWMVRNRRKYLHWSNLSVSLLSDSQKWHHCSRTCPQQRRMKTSAPWKNTTRASEASSTVLPCLNWNRLPPSQWTMRTTMHRYS